jgi:ureidoacrylate peracid hydrolase
MAAISTDRCALIVVDMQNGFCHPRGSFGNLGLDVTMTNAAIGGCRRLVDAAHEHDVPVIFTRYVYRADYADGGVLVQEILPALAEVKSLAAGTWDADIVDELHPAERDFVIDKNRYSAFYGTGLEPILTSLMVDTLVICGVTTNMCVETTARDASQRDYRVFVAGDACGELDKDRHDMALATLGFGFGWVVDSDEAVSAWAGGAATPQPATT